jgi:hypothetical protein
MPRPAYVYVRIARYVYMCLFVSRFAMRAIAGTFIRRNGRDRADRELRHWASYQPAARRRSRTRAKIVSRRDRNYPSQSLVGNISAGWHVKTRTDVRLPNRLNGWRMAREILISRYRMHLSSYASYAAAAAAGDHRHPSWSVRQSALFDVEILIYRRGP